MDRERSSPATRSRFSTSCCGERGLLRHLLVVGARSSSTASCWRALPTLRDLAGELLGQAEDAAVLGQGVEDRLPHPPHRVGDELDVALGVEALGRLDQPQAALVDEVEEGEAQAAVALGVGHHETEVRLHQPLQGLLVPFLDAPAQRLLVVAAEGPELRDLADVGVEAVAGGRARALLAARFFFASRGGASCWPACQPCWSGTPRPIISDEASGSTLARAPSRWGWAAAAPAPAPAAPASRPGSSAAAPRARGS